VKTIYKYELKKADESTIRMPASAEILYLGIQKGNICIWALVDTGEDMTKERLFRIYGTGHEIKNIECLKYIGTIFEGSFEFELVWHIFEFTGGGK
jgi:hypothetical protein